MSKRARLFVIAFALLLTALPAIAEEAVVWECTPLAGAEVYPGDQLIYRFTITDAGATQAWTVLTIRLGEGMRMQADSFVFLGAEASPPPTQSEAQSSAEGETPPPISREVIPGNDGCVILASRLQAGDTAVFCAAAETETAIATATAYTDSFSVEVSHTLVPRPVETEPPATPAIIMRPVATPEPEPEGFTVSDAGRLAVGLVIFAGLLLFVGLLLKDHPIMKRFSDRRKGRRGGARSAKGVPEKMCVQKVRLHVLYVPGLKGRKKKAEAPPG